MTQSVYMFCTLFTFQTRYTQIDVKRDCIGRILFRSHEGNVSDEDHLYVVMRGRFRVSFYILFIPCLDGLLSLSRRLCCTPKEGVVGLAFATVAIKTAFASP